MNEWKAFILGITQGITEYLPVSSSAHLILVPRFLGIQDPGLSFDVFLHLGTIFSTLFYFWKSWQEILFDRPKKPGQLRVMHLVVATIPALVFGVIVRKLAGETLRGNLVLCITLALGGLLLVYVDKKASVRKKMDGVTNKDAFWVGCFQCLALIPGMSRSGSTIIGGRVIGLNREDSARFSFLISLPVTLAAVVFELRHFRQIMEDGMQASVMVVGLISSLVAGCLAIGFLINLLKRFGFLGFAVYRVSLAIAIYLILGV